MFFQFLFLYLCGSQECPSEKHKDDFKVPVRDVEVAGSNPVCPIFFHFVTTFLFIEIFTYAPFCKSVKYDVCHKSY